MGEEMSFSQVLIAIKNGCKAARAGWNGKGIYIELQNPNAHSKMSLPYIYIVTNGLEGDNEKSPRGIVPWLASQTDLLAEDWVVID